MTDSDEVKPCVWCEGQTKRFQMKTADDAIVEMVEHQGWPHCCVRRDSMTLSQWNFRRPPDKPPISRDPPNGRYAERVA